MQRLVPGALVAKGPTTPPSAPKTAQQNAVGCARLGPSRHGRPTDGGPEHEALFGELSFSKYGSTHQHPVLEHPAHPKFGEAYTMRTK